MIISRRFHLSFFLACLIPAPLGLQAEDKPNILWITSEDNGPEIGCYGDDYSETPNIDALAKEGLRYLHCWSNAPVCAPARTTIITGVYPMATGSQHMRSNVRMPAFMKMYPQFLREAGYYCTNNSKEDYNLEKPGKVWNESSKKAHWKNRDKNQPFFAIFNHTVSHESQLRKRPHDPIHDPAKVSLPAYHPDTPEVRRDWAQYYDKLTEMDARVGANLLELREAGLEDDTIVFYYGDHGSGMPRSKRWPFNSGLHVPLIVRIPEKFKHLAPGDYVPGGTTDRLVSFVDLAPTLLSLIGTQPPEWMHGKAFMGSHEAAPRHWNFGFRGRMDERVDLVRSVTDGRYVYIRHYHPHRPCGQHVAYMFQTPTTRVWHNLFQRGRLNEDQAAFWLRKPSEALFDLESDPDEVNNLADSGPHKAVLQKMRRVQENWAREIRDLGFLAEGEITRRCGDKITPCELGENQKSYDLDRILETAGWASSASNDVLETLRNRLSDPDSGVRYWAAMGFLQRGYSAVNSAKEPLQALLKDESPNVRVIAAEALLANGPENAEAERVLADCANPASHGTAVAIAALNAVDELDEKAANCVAIIKRNEKNKTKFKPRKRLGNYIPRLMEKIRSDLE